MDSIKMSYGGFTFNANPSSVKTEYKKNTAPSVFPFRRAKTNIISKSPAVISGNGKFCGKNARAEAQMLLSVFKREGAAYLFSPVLAPVKAYFTALDFSVNSVSGSIDYSFEFTQEEASDSDLYDFGYTLAEENENLFDIAHRTNTNIEKIIDLNSFKTPFDIREGDRIWLK